jgi:hypothetical protein
MKGIFKEIGKLKTIRRLWFGLYFFKFATALLFVIPIYLTTNSVLSSSRFSKTLASHWDISVILEMFFGRGELLPVYLALFFIAGVIYVALMQFVNGGLYYTIVSGRLENIDWKEFFAECGIGFNNHIKITILMLFVYVLLFIAGTFFVNILDMTGDDMIGFTVLVLMSFKGIILLLIILVASVFSDTARATATAYPDKNFREILKIASDFFRPAFFKIMLIFLATFISFVIVWGLFQWLAFAVLGAIGGLIGIVIELLLFQLISFTRTGQKLWYLLLFGKAYREKNQGRFLPEQVKLNLE